MQPISRGCSYHTAGARGPPSEVFKLSSPPSLLRLKCVQFPAHGLGLLSSPRLHLLFTVNHFYGFYSQRCRAQPLLHPPFPLWENPKGLHQGFHIYLFFVLFYFKLFPPITQLKASSFHPCFSLPRGIMPLPLGNQEVMHYSLTGTCSTRKTSVCLSPYIKASDVS